MLYTLNLHDVLCQLYFNFLKSEAKKKKYQKKRRKRDYLDRPFKSEFCPAGHRREVRGIWSMKGVDTKEVLFCWDGGVQVTRTSDWPPEAESDPRPKARKQQEPQSYHHKEMNSANNRWACKRSRASGRTPAPANKLTSADNMNRESSHYASELLTYRNCEIVNSLF